MAPFGRYHCFTDSQHSFQQRLKIIVPSFDCASQDISWKTCCLSLLLLTEFTNMLWVIILHENKSLTYKPHSRWDHVMLQDAPIASLILFAFHLKQIPDFAINKGITTTTTEPLPCFMFGVIRGGCSSFTHSSLHIDPPIWAKDFKLWFISPKNFIPLLYCPVFVHLDPLEPFDILLLPQQRFFDSNSVI